MMRIVALSGGRGAGKDQVAKHLNARFGGFSYAIARDLKKLALDIFCLPAEALWGTQAEKLADYGCGITGRQAMERIGKAVHDHLGPTFFIDRVIERVAQNEGLSVITDVRFAHEQHALQKFAKAANAPLAFWRIHPPPEVVLEQSTDVSDQEWCKLKNDDSIRPSRFGLDELHRCVDYASTAFGLRRPCDRETRFGTDPIGKHVWCVLDKDHIQNGNVHHEDSEGRTWTCFGNEGYV